MPFFWFFIATCAGGTQTGQEQRLAPKLRPRKTGDTSLTSPVMCPGVIFYFFFDIVAPDAHDMHTKFGLLERSRTCAISTYVKVCLIGKHPHCHLFFPARSNMLHSLSYINVSFFFFPPERLKGDLSYRLILSFMIKPTY